MHIAIETSWRFLLINFPMQLTSASMFEIVTAILQKDTPMVTVARNVVQLLHNAVRGGTLNHARTGKNSDQIKKWVSP